MFVELLGALLILVKHEAGTPYVSGGHSPAGTDCSGLVSQVSNLATGRDPYATRFSTANEEQALLARGFQYGSQPGALDVGWNSGHTAATLPDGTPVSSGEGHRGVAIGGGGAYQSQFTHHMFLPVAQNVDAPLPPDQYQDVSATIDVPQLNGDIPSPPSDPVPAPPAPAPDPVADPAP